MLVILIGPRIFGLFLYQLLIVAALNAYYTFCYSQLSSLHKEEALFKVLLTYIILLWLVAIPSLIKVKDVIKFYGETMSGPA